MVWSLSFGASKRLALDIEAMTIRYTHDLYPNYRAFGPLCLDDSHPRSYRGQIDGIIGLFGV